MATIGITIPFEKGSAGYFNMSEDILTQVKSNLINLLLTIKGERLHNPEFGTDLHHIIFEQNTEDTNIRVQNIIETAVERWMPYIALEEVNTAKDPGDSEYTARVYVKYRLLNFSNVTDEILINF